MSEPVSPDCPVCGCPPVLAMSHQYFCGNDDCYVFTWDPRCTLEQMLADAQVIDLSPLDVRRRSE